MPPTGDTVPRLGKWNEKSVPRLSADCFISSAWKISHGKTMSVSSFLVLQDVAFIRKAAAFRPLLPT